jgi:GNAT superfamily N-acetyltransferase
MDVELADAATVDGYYRLHLAAAAIDRPGDPPLTRAAVVGRLRTPLSGQEASHRWVACRAERVVGFGALGFPDEENDQMSRVDVLVHPDERRRGIGTALLAAALPAVRARRRRVVQGAVLKDGPGRPWGDALGFQTVHETVLQELVLAATDRSRWTVPTPAGYQLRWWAGDTPPELLASYATARAAIGDAPLGDSSEQSPHWTADRVRAAEDHQRQRHVQELVVAAIHTATGAVAGLTLIELYPHRPTIAYQCDTAVLAEHRGHRLGLAVKTRMLHWITADRPTIERIYTSCAASNTHMLQLNQALGFTVHRGVLILEQNIDTLTSALG